MSAFYLQFLGRFGNQMFSYAFARAYCEKHKLTLYTDPWVGQHIFDIHNPTPPSGITWQKRDENNLQDGESNVVFRSYCQQQKCMIYSKADCVKWFHLKRQWDFLLCSYDWPEVVGHRRVGDYAGYGYPVVSEASYRKHTPEVQLLTEEKPMMVIGVPDGLSFLPDFYCMMNAGKLLRGNSSFSWWAATLNQHGEIYAPVIDGKVGGIEHDCEFVEGNWPRFANLSFTTDLHLKP